MSFGGGKSKQSNISGSQSTRDALGINTSVAGGQSGNFDIANSIGKAWNEALNRAQSSNVAQSIEQSKSFVSGAQQPFLSKLYADAMKTYQAQPDQVSAAQRIVNPLMAQGKTAYGKLIGLTNPTGQINAQEASLKSGLSDLFGQGRLGINGAATNAGAFGGARQGLEEAALGGEIAKAFTQGRGDIVANANQTALGAAQAAGPMAQQLAALGMSPESARFSGLQGLAGLLGDPTVLSSSMGTSGSRGTSTSYGTSTGGSNNMSSSLGAGKANNFANSLGINLEQALATSFAKGKSNSGNFNMGFQFPGT